MNKQIISGPLALLGALALSGCSTLDLGAEQATKPARTDPQAEPAPDAHQQWIRENAEFIRERCSSSFAAQFPGIYAKKDGVAASIEQKQVEQLRQQGFQIFYCPRAGQSIEDANPSPKTQPLSAEPRPPAPASAPEPDQVWPNVYRGLDWAFKVGAALLLYLVIWDDYG